MRLRRPQIAIGNLGIFISLSLSAQAAAPANIDKLLEQAKNASVGKQDKFAQAVLKLDPKSGDAYAILETSKCMANDTDGQIELGRKAIELNFRDPFWKRTAYNYLYHGYLVKRDWTQALKYCEICYQIEKTSGVAHDLSILYGKMGKMQLSQEYAATSEKISKADKAEFQAAIKQLRDAEDPKTVDSVLAKTNAELIKQPKDPDALMMRARCYRTKKLYAKELADVNSVIAMTPERGALYHRRSEVYSRLGDKNRSAADELEAKRRGFDIEEIRRRMKLAQERLEKLRQRRATMGSGTASTQTQPMRQERAD